MIRIKLMNKEHLLVSKDNLLNGLEKALSDWQIAAPTQKGERFMYDYITKVADIELEYKPTVLSPKKFLFPQEEVLLKYSSDGKISANIEASPLVLFGLRPCDLNGIKILTEAFADDNGDPNYLAKREKAVIIGIDCKKICDKDAFCYKVDSQNANGGYDVMLYEIGNEYLVEMANDKGSNFVSKYFTTEKAGGNELCEFQKQKQGCFSEKPFKNLEKFPETFEKNNHHAVWQEEGSRCLSCGSCIMVCPTCYCFDATDEMDLNLTEGKRTRKWDACMLSCFAVVAGGENFRHSKEARLHHRISRKFNYLMKKHGQSVCVGCGRCVRACLADISPKTIAEKINNE